MKSQGAARTPQGHGRSQRKQLDEIFGAQQRWTLAGMVALAWKRASLSRSIGFMTLFGTAFSWRF